MRALAANGAPVEPQLHHGGVAKDLNRGALALALAPAPAGDAVGEAPDGLGRLSPLAERLHGNERRAGRASPCRLCEKELGVGLTADVDGPLVGEQPWVRLLERGVRVAVAPGAASGLAQIVPGRPGEVAHEVAQLLHGAVVAHHVAVEGLGPNHNAAGVRAALKGVASTRVVVSGNVEPVERGRAGAVVRWQVGHVVHGGANGLRERVKGGAVEPLARVVVGFGVAVGVVHGVARGGAAQDGKVDSAGHGPAGVGLVQVGDHLVNGGKALVRAGLAHLVANGPHDDRRVVEVARNHGVKVGQVVLAPLVGVVVGVLVPKPLVPALVHEVDAVLVAGLHRGVRRGVVGGAQGVVAGFLEHAHAAVVRLGLGGGAKDAAVGVNAAATQQRPLSVNKEAVCAPGDLADAKAATCLVADLATLAKGHSPAIQVWVVGAPQVGVWHGNREARAPAGGHDLLAVEQLKVGVAIVGINAYLELRGVDRNGAHANALGLNAALAALPEPHRAKDAGAGVPARVGLRGVVAGHNQQVLLARAQGASKVNKEGRPAVGVVGELLAVEQNMRAPVHAPKLQDRALSLGGRHKALLVAITAAVEVALLAR